VAFKDIEQLIEPLTLPIRGKNYEIPLMGVLDVARYEEALAEPEKSPLTSEEFERLCLHDVYDEMLADNIPSTFIVRAAYTSLADAIRGRGTAEMYWETGGDPKAIQARVQAALEPDQTTPPAEAPTTRRRATGSGTKTSRKS
jgi:hypothetical protein